MESAFCGTLYYTHSTCFSRSYKSHSVCLKCDEYDQIIIKRNKEETCRVWDLWKWDVDACSSFVIVFLFERLCKVVIDSLLIYIFFLVLDHCWLYWSTPTHPTRNQGLLKLKHWCFKVWYRNWGKMTISCCVIQDQDVNMASLKMKPGISFNININNTHQCMLQLNAYCFY